MIRYIDTPNSDSEIYAVLNPIVRTWFKNKFNSFCLPQKYAILNIHNGRSTLVSATTGSGKTLTAFLTVLNELISLSEQKLLQDKVYCVYVSPLKALASDVTVNLLDPLNEMEQQENKKLGIRVGLRTGDTSVSDRQKMLKKPPHILITTSESLALMLSAPKFSELLRNVKYFIMDECHAFAENKRGAHLSVSMERLQRLTQNLTRIGLSACLDYNEYITLSSGEIIRIGEFVEQLISKEKKVAGNLEYSPVKDVKVISVNEDGKLVPSKVTRAWRIPSPHNIAEVTLQTRKRIRITLNDKFLTLEGGKLVWKEVNKFREGDLIAIPKQIKLGRSPRIEILKFISKHEEIYTKNPNNLIKNITDSESKKRCVNIKILSEHLDIPYRKLIHLREGYTKVIALPVLNRILSLSKKHNFKPHLLCGSTGKHFVRTPNFVNKDFMRLFGLIAADGHVSHGIIEFSNKNIALIEEVKGIIQRLFNRTPFVVKFGKNKKDNFKLIFKSIPASYILKEFGLNFGKKTRTMNLNRVISALPEKFICALISGFLDGDGCVSHSKYGSYLRLHSYSLDFIEQLYHCFVRLGIHPTIITKKRDGGVLHYLQITAVKDRQTLSNILEYRGKAQKLKDNLRKQKRTNFIPIGDIIYEYKKLNHLFYRQADKIFGVYTHDIVTRNYCSESLLEKIIGNLKTDLRLRRLLNKIKNFDVSFEKIKKVEIVKSEMKYVYDLSVGRNHNFIASNIVVHNTIEPIEEIAQFLAGSYRDCDIAKIDLTKNMDLKVLSPVPDLINVTHEEMNSSLYNLIDSLIQEHKTTLIFTNTRSATERVVHHLKERFPTKYTENIGAHHGSLSKKHRLSLEERMRKGELKAIVCSTSLELGIDIGYIDLVILLGSPKSVARCSQRFGRSGHRLHDTIKGRLIVLDRDDLVECGVLLKNVLERNIDKIHIPKNCLDILAQQIYGIAISEQIHINELYKLITKSYCYKDLKKEDFLEVIKYLAGFYTSLEDRYVYAKIWFDEETGMIGKKGKLARVIYMTNIGTIPDETFVTVKVKDEVIGHIDESFLERLRRGDVFVLGGQRYEFLYSKGTNAYVNSTVDRPPTIPSWFSEMLPLSFDLALEIQRFRALMKDYLKNSSKEDTLNFINNYLYVDKNASSAIYNYFKEQYDYINKIPNSKEILIEHYSEEGKKFVVFHTLYGRRVNDVLSRATAYMIAKIQERDVEIGISDNGFYLASIKPIQALKAFNMLKKENLNEIMNEAIEKTEVLKRRFRHCASRALMILRSYKGKRKTVGRQQVSSMLLMNAVKRVSEDFPILKEARREVLEDLMDIDNTKLILKNVEEGKIRLSEIHTSIPSPFAFNLVLQGYLDILKMDDKIEFLRRMHNMVLAKISLKK